MLKRISIGLALGALVISFGLYFMSLGFDGGLRAAEMENSESQIEGDIKFSGGGTRTYQYLANRYQIITCSLILFMVGLFFVNWRRNSLLVSRRLFSVLGTIPLLLALYQFWWIFAEKNLRSQETYWNEPRDSLMRDSMPYEYVCFFFIVILILIQIITPIYYYLESKHTPAEPRSPMFM